MDITVYDGADTIGGNKILLEDQGINLFFDFGLNFYLRNKYFEEFLPPRSRRGLLDMFHMGFLPPLRGIYRDDMEIKGVDMWSRVRVPYPIRDMELHGILLSHAHLDHSGHISFLREDIPIVCSLSTAVIVKAIQDSPRTDFEKEVCYLIPKVETDGLLESGHWKKFDSKQRPFGVYGCAPSGKCYEFWKTTPGSRGFVSCDLNTVEAVGGLQIKAFPVDHSIFGATAFGVKTSQGWIIYTGDLRIHGKRGYITKEFAEAARALNPFAFICEGTHVDRDSSINEDNVYSKAFDVVNKCRSLVVADFGPRNLERLLTFREIAKNCGRKLVITAKDIYLLEASSLASELVQSPLEDEIIFLYKEPKKLDNKWEIQVYENYKQKSVEPTELKRNSADYILCFSFWDINELIEIDPDPGTIYIFSSSEAFNEEQKLDIERLRNWLDFFQMQLIGMPDVKTGKVPEGEEGFHASGHISGPNLLELIETINPRFVIPVHTENQEFFRRNIKPEKLRIPLKGIPITF